MNAEPSFRSAEASFRTWERVTVGDWTSIFRLYHHEVRIVMAATLINDGTTPFSRKKYTSGMLVHTPKSAPRTFILARSAMRRMPWIKAPLTA